MDCELTINTQAIQSNYQTLCKKVGTSCNVAAAVKANGYGLGIDRIAPVLYEAGCQIFYVATLREAIILRQIVGETPRIFTLNGFDTLQNEEYIHHCISPVLSTKQQFDCWQTLKTGSLKAAIQIDTGMNRLGIRWDNATQLNYKQGHNIDLVLSHFACADEPDHPLTRQQFERFQSVFCHFEECAFSLCNSYGIFAHDDYHLDCVRPGMALYGLNPTPCNENPMQNVVYLRSPILQRHRVKKGESAGYGATYIFSNDAELATLNLGYADGYARHLSNNGAVMIHNQLCPIRGRVSMDLVIIDVTQALKDGHKVNVGDWVEIIGDNITADHIAEKAGTIGYEVLTQLGPRYRRY